MPSRWGARRFHRSGLERFRPYHRQTLRGPLLSLPRAEFHSLLSPCSIGCCPHSHERSHQGRLCGPRLWSDPRRWQQVKTRRSMDERPVVVPLVSWPPRTRSSAVGGWWVGVGFYSQRVKGFLLCISVNLSAWETLSERQTASLRSIGYYGISVMDFVT